MQGLERAIHWTGIAIAAATGLATLALSTHPLLSDVLGITFLLSVGLVLVLEYRWNTTRVAPVDSLGPATGTAPVRGGRAEPSGGR